MTPMTLRETLDLIEFTMDEQDVDRRAVRALVDDIRRTLLGLRVSPDHIIIPEPKEIAT